MKSTIRSARSRPLRFILLLACGLALLSTASPAIAETEIENRYVGQWLLQVIAGPRGACRIMIGGEDGTMFGFFYDEAAGYYMRLADRAGAWDLQHGEYYPVVYQIDQGAAVEKLARALDDTFVIFLEHDAASLAPFRQGRLLQIRAEQQTHSLVLQDSDLALQALQDCAGDLDR